MRYCSMRAWSGEPAITDSSSGVGSSGTMILPSGLEPTGRVLQLAPEFERIWKPSS